MLREADKAGTLDVESLDILFDVLTQQGREIIGPTLKDNSVVLAPIRSAADLPSGIRDEQMPGSYRLEKTDRPSLFGYVVGPFSLKNYLYPPKSLLCKMTGGSADFQVEIPEPSLKPRAFIGLRGCDLAALEVLDKVFLEGNHVDPLYRTNREQALLIAVNCTSPGGNCFCASMNTGPRAKPIYDLALTEIIEKDHHYFTVEVGTARGRAILDELPARPATDKDCDRVDALMAQATERMGRSMDTEGIRELLQEQSASSHWDEVAERCLACANCTMVCPTCFCSTVEDTTDLAGDIAERWRLWDSCFTMDYSYIHGGSVRKTGAARYRQWITHKLSTWHDQFGTSGCVGCGRCITWCPVGIDITSEVASLRATIGPTAPVEGD
jgi:ferredoxin